MNRIKAKLVNIAPTYHFIAPPKTKPPYIVWQEENGNDLIAGNSHAEKSLQGTIDLFTKSESDARIQSIPALLDFEGYSYYLNSVQFEEETGMIHYEWVWNG